MADLKTNFRWKNSFIFLFCVGLCLACFLPVILFTGFQASDDTLLLLDTNWTVSINGEQNQPDSLNDFSFPQTQKNDLVILSSTLPKAPLIPNPVLKLYSIHSAVEVFLDGQLIYSYGKEEAEAGRLIGYGFHYISFPDQYAGKELTISLRVTENQAFNGISAPVLSDQYHLLCCSLSESRFRFAVSMFLLVFGVLLSLITLPQILYGSAQIKLFSLGLLSFAMGSWTLCNMDLITFFTNNLLGKVYLEFISFYFLPIPLLLYFSDRFTKKEIPSAIKLFYRLLVAIHILFFCFALIAQASNLVHLPAVLTYSHIFMATDILFISGFFIYQFYQHKNELHTPHLGVILIILFCTIELIRYNISKYLYHFTRNQFHSSLCIGALILIVALFYDYTKSMDALRQQQTRQELLETMAYEDKLTGLGNRRKCDEALSVLLEEDFAVISMDLNNLKYYNDTFGHEKGDELLKNFAQLLKDSFPSPMLPTRIGGDEFFVLIPQDECKKLHSLLDHFYKNLNRFNESHSELKLVTAVGWVTREDFPSNADVHIVCQEADRRMYENKKMLKRK